MHNSASTFTVAVNPEGNRSIYSWGADGSTYMTQRRREWTEMEMNELGHGGEETQTVLRLVEALVGNSKKVIAAS